MNMQKLISNIIAKRNERVELLKKKTDFLRNLQSKLKEYNSLRDQIIDAQGNLIEGSPFAAQLLKHPEMLTNIRYATTESLEQSLSDQIIQLERLTKRFARQSLSLQVFGMAGSGKSTFIQSVSGLNDDVVLTSSGDHCTGVSSFIYNAPEFKAEVFFYTQQELLDIFNGALLKLQAKLGVPQKSITQFDQIASFAPEAYGLRSDDYETLQLLQYSQHYDLLSKYAGAPMLPISEKSQVKQYIAQHDGTKSSDPNHVRYFNYLVVKYVNIYHSFNYKEAGQIVLMDTVGLGDVVNDTSTEMNMYQAIADNSDVVILLYSPKPQGGWRGDESDLCHRLDNLHYIDRDHKVERIDPNTLFFLLNERDTPTMDNREDCKEMAQKFKSVLMRKENILVADLHDSKQSTDRVIVPILNQLTDHIAEIDASLIAQSEKNGEQLYLQYTALLKSISSVLVSAPDTDNAIGFNKLFDDLFKRDLKDKMLSIMGRVKQDRTKPSVEMGITLKKLSNSDSIAVYLRDVEDVVAQGITYHKEFPAIYSEAAITLRHSIPQHFRQINIDMHEQIEERKEEVLAVIAETGRLTSLVKKEKEMTYVEWMQRFLNIIVDPLEYPHFYKSVNDLLTFTIDTNGMLLYRIIKHLNNFDDFNIAQIVDKSEIVEMINYYLRTHLRDAFDKIQKELVEFTAIPNESIYYCIEAFYLSLCLYPECEEELYKMLYRYRHQIWRNEFEATQATSIAFEAWQKTRDTLEQYDCRSEFVKLS